jgi:hypothetical protein
VADQHDVAVLFIEDLVGRGDVGRQRGGGVLNVETL